MPPDPTRCQCDPACKEPPLPNSPFCKRHKTQCSRKAPLTGFEPPYEPEKYNRHKGIRESHNCYTYAFNYLQLPTSKECTKKACPLPFPQPGRAAGYPKWSQVKGKRCPDLLARIMGDVPGSTPTTFDAQCPKGQRKIALVADEKEDYHFYRQDADGYWSHKPGATEVIRKDATGRPIYDPQLASRRYARSGLDYDQFCSFLCIPATTRHRLKRGGAARRTKKKAKKSKKAKKQKRLRRLSDLLV